MIDIQSSNSSVEFNIASGSIQDIKSVEASLPLNISNVDPAVVKLLEQGNLVVSSNSSVEFNIASGSIQDIKSVEASLPLDISNVDPAVIKLLEQGNLVVILLSLCLFFWTLVQFVHAVKKE
jgi:hypothetical protein